MAFVDTNILLRWLLGDHQELSTKAEELVQKAKPGSLIVTDIVVAEIIYVLRSTGRDRQQTSEALLLIGRTSAFKYENDELMAEIIDLLTATSLDFADCYLLVRAKREKMKLETFDKALQKKYLS
ncbi:MAG TPA: PIN domain-containing protein [Candidatus Saccharimonadales bacterium]|nr:PIN domain-containing protein [Candidatus Saccharimonadales bacterium]